MSEIVLNEIKIGRGNPPFIIAEMSGNHNQSLDRALAIVEAAAKAGAHGLKIQTYTPDTMTLNIDSGDFFLSMTKRICGREKRSMNYTEKPIHHGNGINRSLIGVKS